MSTVKPLKTKNTDYINILVLCLCVTAVFFVAWTFTGNGLGNLRHIIHIYFKHSLGLRADLI